MLTPLLCLVVLLSATMIDFAHARCVVAIQQSAGHCAARWSVVQWAGATLGFVIAIKVTFWVLPFEAAGLYMGTLLAVAKQPGSAPQPATLAQTLSQRLDLEPIVAALSSSTAVRRTTWS